MTLTASLFRILLLLLLTPVLLLLGCQSRLIYYPRPYDEAYREMLREHQGVALKYHTAQGSQTAHYIPARKPGKQPEIWLCFGGNGTVALDWLSYLSTWNPEFAYLLVDYPGYGDCKGSPTPGRIRESSRAAFAALAKHLNQPEEKLQPHLGVLAHSIGCAAGLMAANDLGVQKLVLVAPFTTMTDMGKRVLGWPLCYVNLHRFDNRKQLAHAVKRGARVEIFHGTADEIIPVTMSQELAAPHPQQVKLHEAEGWDHNHILRGLSAKIGAAMAGL